MFDPAQHLPPHHFQQGCHLKKLCQFNKHLHKTRRDLAMLRLIKTRRDVAMLRLIKGFGQRIIKFGRCLIGTAVAYYITNFS